MQPLNAFLQKEEFKMLTLDQVLSALAPGDWMVALDLQGLFPYSRPAGPEMLCFVVGEQHFQYAVLPFGLTSAPWVFMKVKVVLAAHL